MAHVGKAQGRLCRQDGAVLAAGAGPRRAAVAHLAGADGGHRQGVQVV